MYVTVHHLAVDEIEIVPKLNLPKHVFASLVKLLVSCLLLSLYALTFDAFVSPCLNCRLNVFSSSLDTMSTISPTDFDSLEIQQQYNDINNRWDLAAETDWDNENSSARLFERSRIKALAGTLHCTINVHACRVSSCTTTVCVMSVCEDDGQTFGSIFETFSFCHSFETWYNTL